MEDIYNPEFIAMLFDEMSPSYGITNHLSSFGFSKRWRKQGVAGVDVASEMVILDLMSGLGECWPYINNNSRGACQIIGVDISSEMCRRSRENCQKYIDGKISVVQENALNTSLEDSSIDRIISCFGLKTFSSRQIALLAKEVWRLLKPGGKFSFAELTIPKNAIIKWPYLLYMRHVIPMIGKIFLGNPSNYRMLATYTESFAQGCIVTELLEDQGFVVSADDLFFGCAKRYVGEKRI